MTTPNSDSMSVWYTSYYEVVRFGRDLLKGGMFVPTTMFDEFGEAEHLLDYFEKPWHWSRRHAWWVANDWPDDTESWERGQEADWVIPGTRLEITT